MSKPKVNKSLCIGCGACESLCPDCFQLGEDGLSSVRESCKGTECDLQTVVDSCPTAAITISD